MDDRAEQSATDRSRLAAGIGAGAVVAVAVAAGVAQHVTGGPAAVPAGSLLVNGAVHRIQSPGDTPLLYVLRDELALRGPKFGCGLGQCGACAVLVGDRETRACITAWSSVKAEVTTLEGLPARWAKERGLSGSEPALHPVQQAWIDQQVPQCGYCQSGMMIAAVDLLGRSPSPTEAQIRDHYTNTPPSPHLCRCGTYMSIIAAVQRAAKAMNGGGRVA